ncbi:MAG: LysM peptidoglycan-binding domain-containing protein [Anaerolineae bacterium]|nr:LysM peptidoglycan-binding domain-containing protein [Anaerolineae bacterium]
MMHHVRQVMTLLLALAVLMGARAVVRAQDGSLLATHTVQAGETLFSIASQYNTTAETLAQANGILNPAQILPGQVLTIPLLPAAQLSSGTPVPGAPPVQPGADAGQYPAALPAQAGNEVIHIVRAGETLFRIALQYNTTADALAQYNGIANPRVIYVGQQIRIPVAQAQATPAPAGTVFPTAGPPPEGTIFPTAGPPPEGMMATPTVAAQPEVEAFPTASAIQNLAQNVGFAYGVQVHLPNQDTAAVMENVTALGVGWVKQVIDWSLYEAAQGAIDWTPLDEMVGAMDAAGLNILLTVTNAPAWARETGEEAGPPADPQTYAAFAGALAQRYAGVVDAYEIWDSPNLRRAWNTPRGISAADYVALLQAAYSAIKLVDPAAVVVTGGLAPTGFNDGVNAVDDRVYLRQMYEAGVAQWADAIGAHPNGWANPPDSTCCRNNRPAVAAWDDHPSFFFKDTLSDYRAIMVEKLDSGTYIWATEFGWGSNDGLNVTPVEALGFVEYTTLDEQAQYVVRGFELGRELGYVGPMFLYNLNFCSVVGQTGEQCLFSLLDPAGNPRPAYFAVENMLGE